MSLKFRTELEVNKLPFEINYSSKLAFIGSCFAENMGSRFSNFRFSTLINPHGILFNPISIFKGIKSGIHRAIPDEAELLNREGLIYSWNAHSSIYNESAEELAAEIHRINTRTSKFLEETDVLFITLGTSWAYRHLETKELVANCHKVPQSEFRKELIDSEDIVDQIQGVHADLKALNNQIKVVFTVSPVRHVRDGLVENNRSKSELIKATHQIVNRFEDCYYLPAYEWVLDDLRDYRYFDTDLVHPNQLAQEYVWDKIGQTFFSEETDQTIQEVQQFLSGFEHKAFQPRSESHQRFLEKLIEKGQAIQNKRGINLRYELNELQERIIS